MECDRSSHSYCLGDHPGCSLRLAAILAAKLQRNRLALLVWGQGWRGNNVVNVAAPGRGPKMQFVFRFEFRIAGRWQMLLRFRELRTVLFGAIANHDDHDRAALSKVNYQVETQVCRSFSL